MPSPYATLSALAPLAEDVRAARWLVTGAAGFIGSHLVEALLALGARVRGLDNLCAGRAENLAAVRAAVGEDSWRRFEWAEADIRSPQACAAACAGTDLVLHQAALGSVPQSLREPGMVNDVNAGGFVHLLSAARDAGVRRIVYASSCAIYGDDPVLPKREELSPAAISPYALTKLINEQYAAIFARCFGTRTVGLRYFNIFGPRQDPKGAYAAVIPLWFSALLRGEPVLINGDGENTRDFCHVANVVQANLRAALATEPEAVDRVYNIGCDQPVSLNRLVAAIAEACGAHAASARIEHREFRSGDIRHSHADTSLARRLLGYSPSHDLETGLRDTAAHYISATA